MDGWIKLHRKLLNNDELFRAASTFPVLSLILLLSDLNGVAYVGRDYLAKKLHLKPSTVYKTLKRLQSFHVLSMKCNNKGTVITILNWSKYQGKSNNKVTTKEQQSNNAYIYKELRIKNKEEETERERIHPPLTFFDRTIAYLEKLPIEDVTYFTATFKVSEHELKQKCLSLTDYCRMHSKGYSDPKAFLRNAIRRDFGERPLKIDQNRQPFADLLN